jgi:hypothetical protein
MDLEGHIAAGPLHSDILDPLDESPGPVAVEEFFRKMDAIKEKHRFNLILTSGLFPDHAQTGPDQAAIFQFRSRRDIDSFNFPTAETSGKFTAVDPIPFGSSFFVLGRDIGRIDYRAVDSLLLELVVDPEATVTRLIHRMIGSSRKVASQVRDKLVHLGRLGKGFMLTMLRKNTHAPALFVDIQSYVNRLTGEIKFVTLIQVHGKPPFGKFLRGTKNYIRKLETCLSFSIIRSAEAGIYILLSLRILPKKPMFLDSRFCGNDT